MKEISSILQKQREFFSSGKTLTKNFRLTQLQNLEIAVSAHEKEILAALQSDLAKPEAEAYIGEVHFTLEEIRFARKRLGSWMKPQKVSTPVLQWPGKSLVYHEPKGLVLIVGPWNYPFQLILSPLIGAIAAGNCAILKPSELAPATSNVIAKLISKTFPQELVWVAEGGLEVSQALLKEPWGHLFYTGGTEVGRIIMGEAAKTLTPVTLELGGKSPCLIDSETNEQVTARRIAWGKFFNAGQTCVAPDYLLVPKGSAEKWSGLLKQSVAEFFEQNPAASKDYARIINSRHFERLKNYLSEGKTEWGGETEASSRFIAPTLVLGVSWESLVMKEEVFGPILPLLEYSSFDEALALIKSRPKPLAMYFFSNDPAKQNRVLQEVSFGGGCINDTLVHLSNPHLPFGGVGDSGMGAYHGRYSFETFSHRKSVLKRSFFFDLKLRYPPYRLALLRKFIR